MNTVLNMKKNKIVENIKQNKIIPKTTTNKKVTSDETSINLCEYKNFSVKCKLGRYNTPKFKGKVEFTNFLKSEKDIDLLTRREDEIYQCFLENEKPPKFHIIDGNNRKKMEKILKKYNITKINRNFYYAGINQGERFIIAEETVGGINVFSVIFVDVHHLIYPDAYHNAADITSNKLCIGVRDKTGFQV